MLDIRLSRLDLRIIKRGSDTNAKFDLFQRLNSYGSPLTAQEIRTAFMVGLNPEILPWLQGLATYPPFVNSLSLSDRLIEEQFDIDLTLRFLMLHDRRFGSGKSRHSKTFQLSLTIGQRNFPKTFPGNSNKLEEIFKITFRRNLRRTGLRSYSRSGIRRSLVSSEASQARRMKQSP